MFPPWFGDPPNRYTTWYQRRSASACSSTTLFQRLGFAMFSLCMWLIILVTKIWGQLWLYESWSSILSWNGWCHVQRVSSPFRSTRMQGGLRIKKIYPGSIFFFKPCQLDLPTYVIRHMSIYSNMTSLLWWLCLSACPRYLKNPIYFLQNAL